MLTLTQLYELGKDNNINLFDGLSLPDDSVMDRDTVINTILMRCGLNYPNFADPNVMASAITIWSAKNQYTFEHVNKIYIAQYSPIENYDRYEDMNENKNHSLTDNSSSNTTKNETIDSSKTSKHTGTDSTTDETQTSAYDASTYQPESKTTSDLVHGETITDTGKSTKGGGVFSTNNKGVSENESTKQNNHIRGNIGVTTANAMQQEEYTMLERFNPYEFIAGLFENDLTLFVY